VNVSLCQFLDGGVQYIGYAHVYFFSRTMLCPSVSFVGLRSHCLSTHTRTHGLDVAATFGLTVLLIDTWNYINGRHRFLCVTFFLQCQTQSYCERHQLSMLDYIALVAVLQQFCSEIESYFYRRHVHLTRSGRCSIVTRRKLPLVRVSFHWERLLQPDALNWILFLLVKMSTYLLLWSMFINRPLDLIVDTNRKS